MAGERAGSEGKLPAVTRVRIHDQISAQINRMITEGYFKPGDRLPAERELAERFKVSRNSVRDALRTLEARGLLEIHQGGGTYVSETRARELYRGMLEALVVQKEKTRSILQVRLILEPGIAFYAAQNATPEALQVLEEALNRHAAKAETGDAGVEEDSLFHNQIAQMTGNPYLVWLLQLLDEDFGDTRDILLKYQGSSAREGHRKILQALKEGDPEGAKEAAEAHLREVLEAYELFETERGE